MEMTLLQKSLCINVQGFAEVYAVTDWNLWMPIHMANGRNKCHVFATIVHTVTHLLVF